MRTKLCLALYLLLTNILNATTFVAASCNVTDVQAAINLASDGDTVQIPSGTCDWAGTIVTTKQIRLVGSSIPFRSTTTITPDASSTGTIIRHNDGANVLITMSTGNLFHIVIANLNFRVTGPTSATGGGYIKIQGSGSMVPLMHDVIIDVPGGSADSELEHAVYWWSSGGVIWNTTLQSVDNLGASCGANPGVGASQGSLVVKPLAGGASHPAWDDADTFGTSDTNGTSNLYIENSVVAYVGQAPDIDDNGRLVLRDNNYIGSSGLTHGATSYPFGGRQVEIYDNTFIPWDSNSSNARDMGGRYYWFRAGTALITGNTVTDPRNACHGSASDFQFIVESATRTTGAGCCTGYSCWHQPGSGSVSGVSNACSSTSPTSCLSSSQTGGTSGNDAFQELDPVYVWGNSGSGDITAIGVTTNDSDLSCNTGNTTTTFFRSGTEYFYDGTHSSSTGAKPGWTRYTYPHPLRALEGPSTASSTLSGISINGGTVQ